MAVIFCKTIKIKQGSLPYNIEEYQTEKNLVKWRWYKNSLENSKRLSIIPRQLAMDTKMEIQKGIDY